MNRVSPTMLGRLLEEISWDGHARVYRQGGRGRENVLTAEALQVLNALPRKQFLGGVVGSLHGGDRETKDALRGEIEDAEFELLPGDIGLVQPDGPLGSTSAYALIEAKRLRGTGESQQAGQVEGVAPPSWARADSKASAGTRMELENRTEGRALLATRR